jgi:hypothetical protein
VVPDLGEYPGAELDAKTGKAEVTSASGCWGNASSTASARSSVAMQAASNYRMRASICLPRVLDQGRPVNVLAAEDLPHPVRLEFDPSRTACPLNAERS